MSDWTEFELSVLRRSYASGTTRVSYDSKSVDYGSADDLLRGIRTIERAIAETTRPLPPSPLGPPPGACWPVKPSRPSHGAMTGPRKGGAPKAGAQGTSADTEVGLAGALLRDRMQGLVRNTPHAAKAVAVPVNNIVGAGIMPRAASGNDKLDRQVDAIFTQWSDTADAGEVLVRRRLRRASDGLPVPLQVQVLEADFLDATKSGTIGARRLLQGIEFDPVGKRRAYWLHTEHPGHAYRALQNGLQSRPVPATGTHTSMRSSARRRAACPGVRR